MLFILLFTYLFIHFHKNHLNVLFSKTKHIFQKSMEVYYVSLYYISMKDHSQISLFYDTYCGFLQTNLSNHIITYDRS